MNTILIVDDSAFMRGILKDLLAQRHPPLTILEADGKAATNEIIKKTIPDLILLDIVMRDNEFEGIEALKEIKELNPNIKVVMLSSVGQISVIDECKNLGAQDYIEKPFDKDKVIKIIDKYLI